MRAGKRLATTQYIEHRVGGAGEECHQYEAPSEDRRFGSVAHIDRDEDAR